MLFKALKLNIPGIFTQSAASNTRTVERCFELAEHSKFERMTLRNESTPERTFKYIASIRECSKDECYLWNEIYITYAALS